MPHIQIITGSTRPNRKSKDIAQWVYKIASRRKDATFELVDIADYNLPLLAEPESPFMSQDYALDHTKRWSATITKADGYIFVTPEYNASVPGALKNAIDHLYWEWTNKTVGFVGYGMKGGSRVIEHLRTIAAELQMADVREVLNLSLHSDFRDYSVFMPTDRHADNLHEVIDQVLVWSQAMASVRK